ncbi:UDP-N-acetylmuramate dehydrogenase [Galbitalea sp. SE-J8]|uniref:UDP-N-acetylmuramate dehydrogenase n=1 Tax=Galbitalea sp. SE-J8 TaxID=3054952 RepID=UPI00259CED56|nr:UDP-N-acetylmuramate dehydrogenase [Galbitalea sp. SE-J8]MDM4762451.1 UDP-N-acetylmuramate dehydrogenase [Galbitalea sp. SE-J8]
MTRPLSDLTTLGVGGPAREFVTLDDPATLVDRVRAVWASGEEWLVLGGGSNLLVADEGFDGTVIAVRTRGISVVGEDAASVVVRAEAGEDWDALVRFAVERGLAGIEAMSGVPGTVGAAPVQNIGAYGQELSDTLVAVDFLDEFGDAARRLTALDLELGYRTSVVKQGRRGIVTAIEVRLATGPVAEEAGRGGAASVGTPVRYAQLATVLGIGIGERAAVADVRAAVLRLRASKGMLLDPADPDSASAGSFFTNPIVASSVAATLPPDAPRYPVAPEPTDVAVPLDAVAAGRAEPAPPPVLDARVKLSAAWLIERAGVARGFALPGSRAAVSSKHTLALVNRGGATASDVAELARYVQLRVASEFGVVLQPEPQLINLTL